MRRMNRDKVKPNNAELNKAILTVLESKYKKDATAAHKMVKDAGYEIYKNEGHFVVRSPKTYKHIYIYESCYHRHDFFHISTGNDKDYKGSKDYINFIDYLDTPYNNDKATRYVPKYDAERYQLRNAKWVIELHTKSIEKLKRDLDFATKRIYEANKQIDNIREMIESKRR